MFTLNKSAYGVKDCESLSSAPNSKANLWHALCNCIFINNHFVARFVCVILMIYTSSEWVLHASCPSTESKNPHNVYFSTNNQVDELGKRQTSNPRSKPSCGDAKAMEAEENMQY